MSTTTIIIAVAVVAVLLLAVGIWLLVRWRRKRKAASPPPAGQPDLSAQLASVWGRFYRDLPARAHHFPTVIVLGEAGAGKSHLVGARVDWRGQANQFQPSAVDSPHLQLYLGGNVVVHELSAPLLHDLGRATRRALVRMWRHVGPSVTVVVVVDARALGTTPPATLQELAQLVRGKISLLPSRVRAQVEVRVCLTHMDQLEGYDELVAVIGAHHGPLAIDALGERHADDAAVKAAARALMETFDPNLAYGLVNRSSEAFARLVGFYATFPVVLTQLAPLLQHLTGDDPPPQRARARGLYLGALVPDSRVGDPFVVDRHLVVASIDRQRRLHRRASVAAAAVGVAAVGAFMASHRSHVVAAEDAVDDYRQRVASGRPGDELSVHRVDHKIERMHADERLWLGHAFLERKDVLEDEFAAALRDQYLVPKLSEKLNRVAMLYVVSLLYASEDNGLRALIRDNLALWVSKLDSALIEGADIPASVVAAYLDVSYEQYPRSVSFEFEPGAEGWQRYVLETIRPLVLKEALTPDDLRVIEREPPPMTDDREYLVRARVVALLSAQVALASNASIKKLLESPLRDSEWLADNAASIRGIHDAIEQSQRIKPTAPATLGALGADLERLLAEQPAGESYRISPSPRDPTSGFTFDVTAWNRKVALAAAALTIAQVQTRNQAALAAGTPAIGFFAEDAALGEVGVGVATQGPTVGLPGEYTADVFARYVAPALDFITDRAGKLGLAEPELAALETLYQTEIRDYAARYAQALRTYYGSYQFDPGDEALPFALASLLQPSSGFVRFLSTVATNATPKVGAGPYYETMSESLGGFQPLATLLASDKGAMPGLAPYQKIIAELAAALDPEAGAAPDDDALPTLAGSLSSAGTLTLGKLTGDDKDRLAQVSDWLTSAGVDRGLHRPFREPVAEVYAVGTDDIEATVAQAWNDELRPLVAPLLARFPFRSNAGDDAAIADLEAIVRAAGKQPGTFWTAYARWLRPVTVARAGRHTWLAGVRGPDDALETADDLTRLSEALWDADGNPIPLPIRITPQPLDATQSGGRVSTLAYLRAGAGAVYAFNQRPGPTTLALQWWDQGVSAVIVTMRKPGTTDTATYSIDEAESPWSFFRLLCRARGADTERGEADDAGCRTGRGQRTWDIPLGGSSSRPVTLTLETDPWAPFRTGS